MKKEDQVLDIYSEEDFYQKLVMNVFDHGRHAKHLFKIRGVLTANDILNRNNFDGIPSWMTSKLLRELDNYGYRRNDCAIDKYPVIDDYFRDHFNCAWCGSVLDNESNTELLLCSKCSKRHERVSSEKALKVTLHESDFDEDDRTTTGVAVELSIKNNSQVPLLINYDELILKHNQMRIPSNYSRNDCFFEEDYIIPGEEVVIKKGFIGVERLLNDDYYIITFTDKTLNKQYIYKFGRNYTKHDYWEIDLQDKKDEYPSMKQAIENLIKLKLPMEYIQEVRDGETHIIDGTTVNKINCWTYPKLSAFIDSVKKQRNETVVYGVFNEPDTYGNKTDKYILLCLDKSSVKSGLYKIYNKGQIYKTTAYGWCETTGIAEPTIACFQVSNGGVWCLPYSIAKNIAPKITEESN